MLSATYAILAALIGLYLGLLLIWTGSLLAPAVAHGLYDFIALLYLVRSDGTPASSA
jgi:membrane protease YdiL (CAAX protease family)